MRDPEVERLAEFLATHAVLLLGLGLVAAVISLVAIVSAVRVSARFRRPILHTFTRLVHHTRDIQALNRLLMRMRALIPSAYLALHLALDLLVAVAVTIFVTLAEEIIAGGQMTTFDVAFAHALHNATSPAWERLFAAVSWLGSRDVITLATLVVGVVLYLRGRMMVGLAWIAAQAGGGLLNMALKETFDRTRPEFADPMLASSSWSFPSGHAMGTFILCGLGCYLVLRERRSWIAAAIAVTLALSWCVLMAFSRLYLGVHYASDVLAGLAAGTAWVAVCVSALEVMRRRRKAFDHG